MPPAPLVCKLGCAYGLEIILSRHIITLLSPASMKSVPVGKKNEQTVAGLQELLRICFRYKSGLSGGDSIIHTRSFTPIFSSFGIVLASGPPASQSLYTCFAGLLYGYWPVPPCPLSFDY